MYYYFYKIRNNINGHYYYGVHSTDNINDGYMGSGTRLWRAYDKYGIENFTKIIMKYFVDKEDMFEYERLIVNKNLVKDPNCYNLMTGGKANRYFSEESKEKNKLSNTINGLLMFGCYPTKNQNNKGKNNSMYGKHHSEEARLKQKNAALKRDPSTRVLPNWTPELRNKVSVPKSEEAKQNMRHPHNMKKKHWKLVDGKRIWY